MRPPDLLLARRRRAIGEISAPELTEAEDLAIANVVRAQEDLGLQVATDGEFRRNQWNVDFISSFENAQIVPGKVPVPFHSQRGDVERMPLGVEVTGKISRKRPIFVEHFKYLNSIARVVPKITIPSPTSMHFRGGREAVDKNAYPDMDEFYADLGQVYGEEVTDLGKAGSRYLQIDEVNLAYLCDPNLSQQVLRNLQTTREALLRLYAKLINAVIAAAPPGMTVYLHLCRGNFKSMWVAEGGYDPVAELLFNEIDAHGYLLEYDSPRAGGFEPLRFLPKGKVAVLGLVTTKTPELEKPGDLKRRIDEAARYVSLDQLALSPQCGFASAAEGNAVTEADEIAKLRLVVETAREVWSSA